ncbi:MarR family winged helix-turn-helix transcriptional regulator [Brevibacterium renqingii]|uniref:MarR family winged helix-turn-helix transcriptional regulator n=1 Tax=Brevibacterium renqingii TaxID=2776916 RepID=UPI001AE02132|nr:MarR family transcriptional regulator [Brevibacterium renqingii]
MGEQSAQSGSDRQSRPSGQPSLGMLAFLAYRQTEMRSMTAVEAAGYTITLSQARLFERVSPEGSRLTELAESAQLTKQSAAYLVDELITGGFLRRSPDPEDGRAKLITITDRGYEVIAVARRSEAEVEDEWRSQLGDGSFDTLRRLLADLSEVTDPFR